MKLIDKDAVITEIKNFIDKIYAGHPFDSLSHERQTALWYIKILMAYINTLEVKEVDLEKEVKNWIENNQDTAGFFNTTEFARHFFELGLKVQKGEWHIAI